MSLEGRLGTSNARTSAPVAVSQSLTVLPTVVASRRPSELKLMLAYLPAGRSKSLYCFCAVRSASLTGAPPILSAGARRRRLRGGGVEGGREECAENEGEEE